MGIFKNWLFLIALSCLVLLIGALIQMFTDWPYIAYAGYIMFGGIIVLWSLIALIYWLKSLL